MLQLHVAYTSYAVSPTGRGGLHGLHGQINACASTYLVKVGSRSLIGVVESREELDLWQGGEGGWQEVELGPGPRSSGDPPR